MLLNIFLLTYNYLANICIGPIFVLGHIVTWPKVTWPKFALGQYSLGQYSLDQNSTWPNIAWPRITAPCTHPLKMTHSYTNTYTLSH